MPLYLCGQAALDVTRYLRANNDGEMLGVPRRPQRLRNAIHTNAGLNALNHRAELLLSHIQGRIEALVPTQDMLTSTKRLITHTWGHEVPTGAFTDLGNDVYISTPPFLFLQMATRLNEVELVALGLELCGSYSRWCQPIKMFGVTVEDEFKGTTYNLKPATTVKRLKTFVDRMKGQRGAHGARQAVKRVLDNAASPMETATYLLLCLPRHMGGRGLPAPVFNAQVNLTATQTHERRFPDLYWPARCLDVEYQSDYAHTGEWRRYRDSQRAIELEAESITVLPLTRQQLMSADEFNDFATSVRRNLGQRTRPLPADWYGNYLELRELLLWGD